MSRAPKGQPADIHMEDSQDIFIYTTPGTPNFWYIIIACKNQIILNTGLKEYKN